MQEMKILISSDIIDICDSIVEHYNCSSECKGMCCKIQKIDFSSKEYFNMLSKVDEKHREILRTQTEYANIASKVKICNLPHDILRKLERERVRQFKTNICPLLEDNKCSIYKYRPETCRHYPFKFEMFLNETILIEPCPLGLDIIFDFAACTIDAFLFTGYDMQTCLNHAFSLLKQIIPIYNDRVYIEKPICHLFFNITNPALIPIFRDHIVNYSVEKRIHERNTLHDFVRSHSSEQVNSTTVKQFMDDFRSGETKK